MTMKTTLFLFATVALAGCQDSVPPQCTASNQQELDAAIARSNSGECGEVLISPWNKPWTEPSVRIVDMKYGGYFDMPEIVTKMYLKNSNVLSASGPNLVELTVINGSSISSVADEGVSKLSCEATLKCSFQPSQRGAIQLTIAVDAMVDYTGLPVRAASFAIEGKVDWWHIIDDNAVERYTNEEFTATPMPKTGYSIQTSSKEDYTLLTQYEDQLARFIAALPQPKQLRIHHRDSAGLIDVAAYVAANPE
jgi:hypothetical protein